MGTAAAIYFKSPEPGTGMVGARVNYDGFPKVNIPALTAILARDGIDKMRETMTDPSRSDWRSLRPEMDSNARDDISAFCAGYGEYYTDSEPLTIVWALDDVQPDLGESYTYVVAPFEDGGVRLV